jgi:serine protease Do
MYEYGSGSSDSSKSSSSEYRYSGPFYQDNIGSGSGHRTTLEVSEGKKKSFPRLMFKAVCVALVFGIVASVAFQATNYVGVQLRGENAAAVTGEEPAIVPEIETVAPQIGDIQRPGSGDVTAIVQECMPSLVAITNVSIREVENFWGFGWYNMPQQREQTSTGTGIVIGQNDTELLIVTNNHVIAGATNLTVLFSVDEGRDGASAVEAQIKGTDASKDVGVIAVPLKDIPAETLNEIKVATIGDSSQLQVGEQVVAIGNALGYGQSVTTGIISALNRDVTLQNDDGSLINNSLIQTDAAINPGNSGGALLNMNGEVIGINEAKYSSSYVEGVGYAIPISDVEGIIGDLKTMTIRPEVDAEKIGYLGINCQDVTEEISKQYDMPVGIYLKSVVSGCAADNAGLKRGDILTRFDGIGVSTYDSLRERLQYYEAGETVEVTVMSPENGEYVEKTVTVTLSSKEEVEVAS